MFTFAFRAHDTAPWFTSMAHFRTIEEAAEHAKQWMLVNFENDAPTQTKLVKV